MKYLLDTDHANILQMPTALEFARVSAHVAGCTAGDVVFSVVSFHEQVMGANTVINRTGTIADLTRGYRHMHELQQWYAAVRVLPFEQRDAALFNNLRAARVRIGTMDLRLAVTALSRGLIMVTRNTRDFGRVPSLTIEDWTK